MPRIPNSLIARAHRIHPYLALLLRPCRDIDLARNELRWLRDHVKELHANRLPGGRAPPQLWDLCKERSRGRPLQYLIGTQPFGSLDILCRKGTLIPRSVTSEHNSPPRTYEIRPETEALTIRFAEIIRTSFAGNDSKPLRIVDVGTGSGCIALLLYRLLYDSIPNLTVVATDVSLKALRATRRNIEFNIARRSLPESARHAIRVSYMDVTDSETWKSALGPKDASETTIVVSNPPYISHEDLSLKTERSARLYEPKLALTGDNQQLQRIHAALAVFIKRLGAPLALLELDSSAQAIAFMFYWWSSRQQDATADWSTAYKERYVNRYQLDFWDNYANSLKSVDAVGAHGSGNLGPWNQVTRALLLVDETILKGGNAQNTSRPFPALYASDVELSVRGSPAEHRSSTQTEHLSSTETEQIFAQKAIRTPESKMKRDGLGLPRFGIAAERTFRPPSDRKDSKTRSRDSKLHQPRILSPIEN